jgi:hypothetical protein
MAINDYYDKRLMISDGNISLSVSRREALSTTKDVEKHSFSDHANANSEREKPPH